MYTVDILEGIHDTKLRRFLQNNYYKIHVKLGYLFDVYIRDIFIDSEIIDLDDVVYKSVEVNFAIVPRPEVFFCSKFLSVTGLNLPSNTKVVLVPPTYKNPLLVTKYSLHKLMSPTLHELNANTRIGNVNVICDVRLYSDTVIETVSGGVVGKPS